MSSKQKISILGCGWLGMPLAQHLILNGYRINASTTTDSKLQKIKAAGITPFLINIDEISANIQEFLNSEVLIIAVNSKNIDGFKQLIIQIENSTIRKIIFISSTSVYDNSIETITEKTPLKNCQLKEIENLFISNSGFSTTIIRFGGLFGYMRKPGNFFPENKKIGNPEGFVNMIHRDDCIFILEQIISKEIWNETLNACADTHPTRRNFYTKAKLDLGLKIPDFEENDIPEFKIVSNQNLKKILAYEFKHPDLMDIKEENNE
ncbi:MAG: NAD(P)H-binding protein [Bacteroidales bacterium]